MLCVNFTSVVKIRHRNRLWVTSKSGGLRQLLSRFPWDKKLRKAHQNPFCSLVRKKESDFILSYLLIILESKSLGFGTVLCVKEIV